MSVSSNKVVALPHRVPVAEVQGTLALDLQPRQEPPASLAVADTGSEEADIVPIDRFEPDSGPDDDPDPLRDGLANLFGELDAYVHVEDPLVSGEVMPGSLAGDIADVALALTHGMRHFHDGNVEEALWWWQFSYLSSWGDQAILALRAVTAILSHLRLDADDEVVGEAEFDALHP